ADVGDAKPRLCSGYLRDQNAFRKLTLQVVPNPRHLFHLPLHHLPHLRLNRRRPVETFLAEGKFLLPESPIYEGMLRSPPGTFSPPSAQGRQSTLLASLLPLRGSFRRFAFFCP